MAQTSINIRIDKNLKHDFESVCNEIGLSMSAAFNVFAKTVITRKEIPFKLTTRQIISPDEEWGHLSTGELLSTAEVAGIAGNWDNKIQASIKGKSAWADAAVKKEIRLCSKASSRKRNVKKHGIVGH